MLRTKVKASSLTNLTDARYFAAWAVEWLGFNLDARSESHIPPQVMKAISGWVEGVKIVGEFNMQQADEILSLTEMLQLELVQVGMFAGIESLIELTGKVSVIKEVIAESDSTEAEIEAHLDNYAPYVQYFLLNFDKNGINWNMLKTGGSISFEFLRSLCEQYPVILSMHLSAKDLNEMLTLVHPEGINVKGGMEEKAGFKSFDQLDALFETLVT